MASVNKVIIIGNLGRDPETRYAAESGTAICNIAVATSRRYKNSQGDLQEETEWHRVVFFGRQAEVAQTYLKKGSPVYVEGRLRTRRYTDKDGIERYQTEIICETMQLIGPRPQTSSSGDDGFETSYQPRSQRPAQHAAPRPAPARTQPQPQQQPAAAAAQHDSLADDDIPF